MTNMEIAKTIENFSCEELEHMRDDISKLLEEKKNYNKILTKDNWCIALYNYDIDAIKIFIKHKFDINVKCHYNQTALIQKVRVNNIEIVKLLLDAGADVNIQDDFKSTALLYAVEFDNVKLIELLLNAGADVNVKDNNGTTPLLSAVIKKYFNIVKLLLNAGADVNIQDDFENTVLISAVRNKCHIDIIRLLLDAGVDINIKDGDGKIALDYAKDYYVKHLLKYRLQAKSHNDILEKIKELA